MKFIDFFSGSLKKYLFLSFLLFTSFSCKDDPVTPPEDIPKKDTITISIGDVTHRSVNINIKTTLNNPSRKIKFFRSEKENSFLITEYPISVTDTTIVDDNNGVGLSINTNYTWFAVSADSLGTIKDSSNKVQTTTLDTTSHNYTWEEFLLGNGLTNTILDVWGTNENNVWAIGGIRIDGKFYGGFHWNGSEWLLDSTVGGEVIYGFSENDIWAVGGGVFHYNGTSWEDFTSLDTIIFNNKPFTSLWGKSSSNLFFGTERGGVIHWDGTKADVFHNFGIYITDINGTDYNDIWVTCYTDQALIARFNGLIFEEINSYPPIRHPMYTIFPQKNKEIYVGGNGVFRKRGDSWITEDVDRTLGGIYKIRGSNANNIFAVGAYCTVHHYNGSTWKYYDELRTPEGGINYGVFVTDNKVFIVGINKDHQRAKIIIGTKVN